MTQLRAIRVFYDNRHGLVTLEDDVLGIVRRVRELYEDRITVHLDDYSGEYYFVEHCEDRTERLIFATPHLDERTLDRLQRSDSQSRIYEDPYDAAEREQDEADRLRDKMFGEKVQEIGEEMAHALRKDGRAPRLPTPVHIPRGLPNA